MLEYFRLGAGIDRSRRLIEHEYVRILAHEGSAKRDLLPLPAGQFAAVLEPSAELGPVTVRQLVDEFRGKPLHRRTAPARLVIEGLLVAGANVLADHHLVARKILENHADAPPQRALVPFAKIHAVEQDAPARRRIQPRQQLD